MSHWEWKFIKIAVSHIIKYIVYLSQKELVMEMIFMQFTRKLIEEEFIREEFARLSGMFQSKLCIFWI